MEEKKYINAERPVYFSYARNSQKKPEWEHISDCMDKLLETFNEKNIEYRLDKRDIGTGDKISDFENEIGWNSEVVVIVFSDKYFRSMHCMYEFVQIKNALEKYPEKRLMCIKSGDFNLSDVNYIRELERYWGNLEQEYKQIEFHRLREHSGTEKAAWQNGFYLNDVRELYSFFSSINYSNAQSIDYENFTNDIIKYYENTPEKPELTPKPEQEEIPEPKQEETETTPQEVEVTVTPTIEIEAPQQSVFYVMVEETKKQPGLVIALLIGFLIWGLSIFGNSGSDTTAESDDTEYNPSDQYVDLGLPSGTLWATCNIGANAPEECGDYFAQGEWGNNYCVPTESQFQELIDKCHCFEDIKNDKSGIVFRGPNGNSIFLPKCGMRDSNFKVDGLYWSSSPSTRGSDFGMFLFIYSHKPEVTSMLCISRLSVRPVRRK
ncbi:MAG: toll/interleukin-1 receptor domain-containing protein [Bacteroidales bacterium]|nr:toll/interleukin-1 receptor domain-containing protein [Bacteroidales bacterium]